MIDLTPIDVRKKKGDFRRSVRGYDPAAVDQFLELVADRLEELVRQAVSQEDRATRLEQLVADFKEREQALTEALVTAQEVREEVKRQAERSADLVRREAEADAEQLRHDAVRQREQEEDALRRLRARREQFMSSYRHFLEREIAELEAMRGALEAGGAEPDQDAPDAPSRTRFAAGRAGASGAAAEHAKTTESPPRPRPLRAPPGEAGESDEPEWLSSLMEDKP